MHSILGAVYLWLGKLVFSGIVIQHFQKRRVALFHQKHSTNQRQHRGGENTKLSRCTKDQQLWVGQQGLKIDHGTNANEQHERE